MVELIVVVAVLAILAAIAVPIAGSLLSDSNASADASNVQMLQDAVEKYVAQNHAYPTTAAEAVTAIQANTTLQAAAGVLVLSPRNGSTGDLFLYDITTHLISVGTVAGTDVAISQAQS